MSEFKGQIIRNVGIAAFVVLVAFTGAYGISLGVTGSSNHTNSSVANSYSSSGTNSSTTTITTTLPSTSSSTQRENSTTGSTTTVVSQTAQTASNSTQTTQFLPAPSARSSMGMVYDAADGYVVMFGGATSSGRSVVGDTWKFSDEQWTELNPSQSPSAREGQRMVYDASDGYVMMFGGTTDGSSAGAGLADTWKFANDTWTELSPSSSPSDRYDFGMAYDTAASAVILFGGWVPGGACGNDVNDIWSYSSGSWSQVSVSEPFLAAQATGMVYDPSTGGMMIFGGQTNNGASPSSGCGTQGWSADTWFYGGASISIGTTVSASTITKTSTSSSSA